MTTFNESSAPLPPDRRHVLKLEPDVNGRPQIYTPSLTKGYYNGCLLTITSGPAQGQSTRVVDYDYVANLTPASGTDVTRLFRFRVMAFPRADGQPLQVDLTSNHDPEIADLAGARIMVNGRPFNGTGVGYDPLAPAGQPRLSIVENIRFPNLPATALATATYPEVALTPNSVYTVLSDPKTTGPDTGGIADFASGSYLNPKATPVASRPNVWKYQSFAGPGDTDESYDAADFQNMFLALQTVTPRSRGRVVQNVSGTPKTLDVDDPFVYDAAPGNNRYVNTNQFLRLDLEDLPLPSFHRPDLINYWYHRILCDLITAGTNADDAVRAILQPYGKDGIRDSATGSSDDPTTVAVAIRDQIVALKRKISMRPLREDHPNFDGSNPLSRGVDLTNSTQLVQNGNIAIPYWEAVGPWDVDNDKDGVPDSVWVDLGDAGPAGRRRHALQADVRLPDRRPRQPAERQRTRPGRPDWSSPQLDSAPLRADRRAGTSGQRHQLGPIRTVSNFLPQVSAMVRRRSTCGRSSPRRGESGNFVRHLRRQSSGRQQRQRRARLSAIADYRSTIMRPCWPAA